MSAGATITPGSEDVLLVVDVQNCFVPGGTLPVAGGHEVVPLINRLAGAFAHVVLTQDWHTPRHISFASSHPGKKPFDTPEHVAELIRAQWGSTEGSPFFSYSCRGLDDRGAVRGLGE